MKRYTLHVSIATLALVLLIAAGAVRATVPYTSQRATLPPTWTPTFTPTDTLTPSPTLTPSVTPTIAPEVYCAENFYAEVVEEGASLAYTAELLVLAGADRTDTLLLVEFVHRLSGEPKTAEFGQPGYIGYVLPVRRLPRPGLYDWSVTLVDATGETVCAAEGYFFVGRQEWVTPTETPEGDGPEVIVVTATPEGQQPDVIIVTATPEATQTPFIIVVTATPEGENNPSIREQSAATAITPDS